MRLVTRRAEETTRLLAWNAPRAAPSSPPPRLFSTRSSAARASPSPSARASPEAAARSPSDRSSSSLTRSRRLRRRRRRREPFAPCPASPARPSTRRPCRTASRRSSEPCPGTRLTGPLAERGIERIGGDGERPVPPDDDPLPRIHAFPVPVHAPERAVRRRDASRRPASAAVRVPRIVPVHRKAWVVSVGFE